MALVKANVNIIFFFLNFSFNIGWTFHVYKIGNDKEYTKPPFRTFLNKQFVSVNAKRSIVQYI